MTVETGRPATYVSSLSPDKRFRVERGWLAGARRVVSPNFGQRPPEVVVDMLVIHNISLPPGRFGGGFVEDFFCNRLQPDLHPYFAEIWQLRVSAHLYLDRDGAVTQFVNLNHRAWHAGASHFAGRDNCNDFSIGIELEGCDEQGFTDPQYDALIRVGRALCREFPHITPQRIVGHSDIAPGRKTDPGPHFDWQRLRQGMSHGTGAG